ncbi:MAG: hypothetical protein A3H50_03020 [Candidatus Levybacteria bacterium RIFCSPLOWO2_02_FULL_37_10]|nr:MAG: hypothetical protein A2860_02585 [Candidatus Levybacteria bacterium RIFCSPHIGHO2_01_FULL_37_33]OGH15598.1 MAG: hypothetical protein A3C97_01265 [Candidatus Levybacteria bacterium RIFCSPHIGHO2_02_FULL_37_11]OGH29694.1 MAG: hypothetical protein A3F30_02950 [Candidatus Levybacteria bacterium RIFCSPHIGHO2_12_FULL_37_12]OGH45797.1 MAG: hypothetical protein A3H50_03020 [Candidatus Levybacteria bacterium RIFCSPLOWO2_02_FULL_37_10]
MKKILNILISSILISCFSIYLYISIPNSYAARSPTPTESLTQQQINALTNKIASRVAQLKLVEKRGVIGKVTDVSNTQITLSDMSGNTRFVDVDEFTKFKSDSKSFGISDIEKGQKIGALGLYNKQSRRILARFVEVLQIPDFIHGAVSQVDSKNFSIEVALENGKRINIEVENSTKTLSFDREKSELVRSGFSKITEGENIIIIGFPSKTDSNTINASKIILLPNVSKNPKIKIQTPTPTPTPTPGKTIQTSTPTPKKPSAY